MSDDVLEERIHAYFQEATEDLEPPAGLVDVVAKEFRSHRRARATAIGGVVALALVGSVFVGRQVGESPNASSPRESGTTNATSASGVPRGPKGAVLRLDGHAVALPGGYHLVSDSSSGTCRAVTMEQVPGPIATTDQEVQAAAPKPYSSSQIASAVAAGGGCVTMVLTNPYVPTETKPDIFRLDGSSSETIDGHASWLAGPASGLSDSQAELGVQLPTEGGRVQDLIVGTNNIDKATLLAIVRQGLD